MSDTPLKHTPLHAKHVALGAKMVPFAGYEMPVHYPTGIVAEHQAVRTGCGLFDVSHMGEFVVTGPQAVEFVSAVTCNDVAALAVGQVHYSGILTAQGTFVDDCLVYRSAERVMLVVNASNKDKDLAHITEQLPRFKADLVDISDDVALLAVQGPRAQAILQPLTDADLESIKYYHFVPSATVCGVEKVIVSRTGYTGEDGFELYFAASDAERMWDALLATGAITPAGLGCRDSLRLEMGMALYGNDIDDGTTPYEANLGWMVKPAKGPFTGAESLAAQKTAGVTRKLVGFTFSEKRAIPRHGYPVWVNGEPSGTVCSGCMSPSLGYGIGTAYVPAEHAKPGNTLEVEIRGQRVVGTIVKPPFYTDASHR